MQPLLHMESARSTILLTLVLSGILREGSASWGIRCSVDHFHNVRVSPAQPSKEENSKINVTCEEGWVPLNFQNNLTLTCTQTGYRAEYINLQRGLTLRELRCVGEVVFRLINTSSTADSITVRGYYTVKTWITGTLTVELRCDLVERYGDKCRMSHYSPARVRSQPFRNSVNQELMCKKLYPFSRYRTILSVLYSDIASHSRYGADVGRWNYGRKLEQRKEIHTLEVNTTEGVPDKPKFLDLDLQKKKLRWDPLKNCNGPILNYQITIIEWWDHNEKFTEEKVFNFSANVSLMQLNEIQCATKYNISLRARSSMGWGPSSNQSRHSTASGPRVPDVPLSVSDITDSTVVVYLKPVLQSCVPI
ncbi:uncharacterized protein, partial [Heterodontus francisci]|uniref:uncharacterized protein n=1 Tax=Heterodontus francisci TaxID=7792 RepID=UPI00355BE9F8